MTVIAELTVAASEFHTGRALARDPGTSAELVRVVPSAEAVMPYVWVESTDLPAFERQVGASPHIERLVTVDVVNNQALYRIEWADDVDSLVDAITAASATILEGRGGQTWAFCLRFEDYSALARFHNYCRGRGIDVALTRVYDPEAVGGGGEGDGLTDQQRDALRLAVERGYFEVPQGASLSDLAAGLGVSPETARKQVHRGANSVLHRALSGRATRRV